MTNLKKVLLSITIVLLIVTVATVVNATTGDITVITDPNVQPTTPSPNDILNGTNNNRTNNNTTNTNTNRNTSTYNNSSNLPKTGAEDYTLTLVIGALAVVAIVTYRRVKFYKDI